MKSFLKNRPRTFRALAAISAFLGIAALAYLSLDAATKAPILNLTDIDGNKFSTNDFRGKVFMINFWETSCASCIEEMPKITKTYQKYHPQGLEILTVALQSDTPSYVSSYARTRKLPFHVAFDTSGEAAKSYGNVVMTPTTFVIGRAGTILKRYVGQPSETDLSLLLEKALGSHAASGSQR